MQAAVVATNDDQARTRHLLGDADKRLQQPVDAFFWMNAADKSNHECVPRDRVITTQPGIHGALAEMFQIDAVGDDANLGRTVASIHLPRETGRESVRGKG